MTACVRIYTVMGKENCVSVDSFSVTQYIRNELEPSAYHVVEFQDSREDTVTQIERIVEAGQPCNMHIRYEDSDVEAVCTLNGCKLEDSQIVCEEHDLKLLGWTGQ